MSAGWISLITSVITVVQMNAAGARKTWAWPLGLANQLMWLWLIIATQTWGLLVLLVALVITYSRNWWLWARDSREVAVA